MSARKNREDIVMFLFEEGGKLELLAKIFTLAIIDGWVGQRHKRQLNVLLCHLVMDGSSYKHIT